MLSWRLGEKFCYDDLMHDERICSESAAGKVKEQFDDDYNDLLSEGVTYVPNGDADLDLGDDLGYV